MPRCKPGSKFIVFTWKTSGIWCKILPLEQQNKSLIKLQEDSFTWVAVKCKQIDFTRISDCILKPENIVHRIIAICTCSPCIWKACNRSYISSHWIYSAGKLELLWNTFTCTLQWGLVHQRKSLVRKQARLQLLCQHRMSVHIQLNPFKRGTSDQSINWTTSEEKGSCTFLTIFPVFASSPIRRIRELLPSSMTV